MDLNALNVVSFSRYCYCFLYELAEYIQFFTPTNERKFLNIKARQFHAGIFDSVSAGTGFHNMFYEVTTQSCWSKQISAMSTTWGLCESYAGRSGPTNKFHSLWMMHIHLRENMCNTQFIVEWLTLFSCLNYNPWATNGWRQTSPQIDIIRMNKRHLSGSRTIAVR